jgi:electron-transferring-flavoprotein dehydrogenase
MAAPRTHPDQDRRSLTIVFYWLGQSAALRLPNFLMPPLMSNHGNFIRVASATSACWLRDQGRGAQGVEIYPGFAAAEVACTNETGRLAGVATGDMGVRQGRQPNASFTRGMELRAKYTLFAEGAAPATCRSS